MICKPCKNSFYGQGFSKLNCLGCNILINSVHTPCMKYCKACAEKLNICEQCGEKLEKDQGGK
jgi:hypothetical protein